MNLSVQAPQADSYYCATNTNASLHNPSLACTLSPKTHSTQGIILLAMIASHAPHPAADTAEVEQNLPCNAGGTGD